MSYAALPPEIRGIAKTQLTAKQHQAFTLEQDNLGIRHIARTLHISRPAVLDRLDGAHRALRRHGVIQDADGTWAVRPQEPTSEAGTAESDIAASATKQTLKTPHNESEAA